MADTEQKKQATWSQARWMVFIQGLACTLLGFAGRVFGPGQESGDCIALILMGSVLLGAAYWRAGKDS